MADKYVDVTLRFPEKLLAEMSGDAEDKGVTLSAYLAVVYTERACE